MERKIDWPKAVVYDSKTTLFDWATIWRRASSKILKKYESDADVQEFTNTWHKFLLGESFRAAFGAYRDLTDYLRDSLIDTFKHYGIPGNPTDVKFLVDLQDEVQPFPDTVPALTKQKEMTKVIIFSNVETKYLEMYINKLGNFRPDFAGASQQARAIKPSPRAYHWVLEQAQLEGKDVLYCASPQWDVQGAIACGITSAWLKRSGQLTRNLAGGVRPDYEVADLNGITKIVESKKMG